VDTPLRPDADPSWRELHALAAQSEPAVVELVLAAIARLLAAVATDDLFLALARRDPTNAMAAIPLRTFAPSLAELSAVLEELAQRAGRLARQRMLGLTAPPGVVAELVVDLISGVPTLPTIEIAEWARGYAGSLAEDLSAETRKALQGIIERAVNAGQAPKDTAKLIEQIIGLNRRQASALERYRAALVGEGLTGPRLNRLVTRYANRLRKMRALAIARSETITAANQGNLETWRRNVREGVLDPSRWLKEWLAIGDPRTCPDCAALDGQRARIDQPFISPAYGEVWTPALHTNCRCSVALVRAA
jgi:SPP1 gp7 family putative phage head morphogenesis protein